MTRGDRAALVVSLLALAMAMVIGKVTLDLKRLGAPASAYGVTAKAEPQNEALCWPALQPIAISDLSSNNTLGLSATLPDPNAERVLRVKTETIPADGGYKPPPARRPRQECRARSYWSVKYGECRLKRYGYNEVGGGESPLFVGSERQDGSARRLDNPTRRPSVGTVTITRTCRRVGIFGQLQCIEQID